jgi:hypothetical protein
MISSSNGRDNVQKTASKLASLDLAIYPGQAPRRGKLSQIPRWQTWAHAAQRKIDQQLNANKEETMVASP